jgi:hypothetical protein
MIILATPIRKSDTRRIFSQSPSFNQIGASNQNIARHFMKKLDITTDIEIGNQRKSKYRNITGKKWKLSERHENIQIGTGQKLSNLVKANEKYFAIPVLSNSGVLSYRKIVAFGKWEDVPNHTSNTQNC